MFRTIAFFLFILITRITLGQNLVFEYDTINNKHVTLGDLEMLDLTSKSFSSSFLFPNESRNSYTLRPKQLFFPGNSIYPFSKLSDKNLIFSALPHIGFGYAFGAQSTQKLDFDYQQAFKHGIIVNAAIHNFKTDGFFRNTNALDNLYKLALARNGKWHSFQLRANSEKVERNWNGGIQNDSLVETFSPNLIPIWKENAHSIYKNTNIQLYNKFLLIQDSTKQLGFSLSNEYNRFKRFYFEEDSIASLYSIINIDSSKTNDSLLQQTYHNNVGLFFKNRAFQLQTGLSSSYWNYRAFEYRNDTLELGIYGQIDLDLTKFKFHQKGNLNLLGAANGFHNSMSVNGKFLGVDFTIVHQVFNELPSLFQRFFYSNNLAYKTANLEKQWFQNLKAKVGRCFGKQAIELAYELGQFNNVYQFDSQQLKWRNDLNTSNGIYQQASLKSNLNWRWLNLHLNYEFTAIDESKRFTPNHLLDTRLFVKGGVFKAKKLKALAGVDFMITSAYKRLDFLPQMTLFDLEKSTLIPISSGFMNMGAFCSFEVETFRLFLRMDNLAYFWQNRQIEIINGYTFPSTQLKVGITWDFWN
jgi:hypothetical protein